MGLVDKLFGNKSEKEIKRIEKYVDAIEALDEKMQALSDEELRAKTQEFKERLAAGETLDDLLVEAFAVVREAADRTIHLKHYPVQLMGGIILHQGHIAEMKTGEGKTLTATLPVYLNALTGKGVHVITVNDYLAERDARNNGKVLEFLGLPDDKPIMESDLEKALVRHIENFLLELGKGFMFIGTQQRVTLFNTHYYVDMVFYNKILRC